MNLAKSKPTTPKAENSNSIEMSTNDIFIADVKSLCNESKGLVIDDKETCLIAISLISDEEPKVQFRREENATNWPKGCYLASGDIYFNKHSLGNRHSFARPICRKKQGNP